MHGSTNAVAVKKAAPHKKGGFRRANIEPMTNGLMVTAQHDNPEQKGNPEKYMEPVEEKMGHTKKGSFMKHMKQIADAHFTQDDDGEEGGEPGGDKEA